MLCLMMISAVSAESLYVKEGIILSSENNHTVVVIDYQQYRLDHETQVHGGLVQICELAPILNVGQKIGFNIEQGFGELSRITEVWLLQE